mmetsp:Transcript_52516/g.90338  ORF Transcript_52516/g.90338 Transcript_52516/m.90338 type:complete len:122 (+) Transcript_52516:1080-1445(+)
MGQHLLLLLALELQQARRTRSILQSIRIISRGGEKLCRDCGLLAPGRPGLSAPDVDLLFARAKGNKAAPGDRRLGFEQFLAVVAGGAAERKQGPALRGGAPGPELPGAKDGRHSSPGGSFT